MDEPNADPKPDPKGLEERLWICGAEELSRYKGKGVTHFISVANPGAPSSKPPPGVKEHLELWFGDVVSEADARQCHTQPPRGEDIRKALEFFRAALGVPHSRVLVSCDYGASRSPALAYVLVADQLGAGQESSALQVILQIRPDAVPNRLVVQLGDILLERSGALVQPLNRLYSKLNDEIMKTMGEG